MLNEKLISLLAACALTVTGLVLAAPAVAKEKPVVVTATTEYVPARVVSYRDLNLATAKGEKSLVRRVGFAVTDVCIESIGITSGLDFADQQCRRAVWTGVRPQIALAVQRAKEIAAVGHSAIPAVAIAVAYNAK